MTTHSGRLLFAANHAELKILPPRDRKPISMGPDRPAVLHRDARPPGDDPGPSSPDTVPPGPWLRTTFLAGGRLPPGRPVRIPIPAIPDIARSELVLNLAPSLTGLLPRILEAMAGLTDPDPAIASARAVADLFRLAWPKGWDSRPTIYRESEAG